MSIDIDEARLSVCVCGNDVIDSEDLYCIMCSRPVVNKCDWQDCSAFCKPIAKYCGRCGSITSMAVWDNENCQAQTEAAPTITDDVPF